MSYHINTDGNAGLCTARIRCPFGDLETQHYETAEEARSAYELAMSGTSMPKRNEDLEKFLEKKRKRIGKMDPDFTPIESSSFVDPAEVFTDRAVGDEVLGGKLEKVTARASGKFDFHVTFPDGGKLRFPVALDDYGNVVPGQSFDVNKPSKADLDLRRAEANEHNARVAVKHVLGDVKRMDLLPPIEETYIDAHSKVQVMYYNVRSTATMYVRTYRDMVKQAEDANVAYPHTFALNRLEKEFPVLPQAAYGRPYGFSGEDAHHFAIPIIGAIARQDSNFKPSSVQVTMIQAMFKEGERPYLDYTFDDLNVRASPRPSEANPVR